MLCKLDCWTNDYLSGLSCRYSQHLTLSDLILRDNLLVYVRLGNIVFVVTIVIYVAMLRNTSCFVKGMPRTNNNSTFNKNHKTEKSALKS